MRTALLLGVITLFGCDNAQIGPSPPPTTTTAPPPRIEPVPFSWDYYKGFTAFALGHPGQSEEDIQRLYAEAMSYGWNTARICAETEFWSGDGYPTKHRDPERLVWLLDVIARIPGAQVLLIGDCTLKRQVSLNTSYSWAWTISKVVSGWDCPQVGTCVGSAPVRERFVNVAIETHNEFDNCRGRTDWGGSDAHCPGKQDVRRHIEIYKAAGIQNITADDSICYGPEVAKTYQFRLANIGAWPPDFHPCRDRRHDPWDPDVRFLEKIRAFNGEPFVLSETVAWMDYSGQCEGLKTCDRDRINRFIANCAAVPGCRFTFHSESLLAGEPPSWWPYAK